MYQIVVSVTTLGSSHHRQTLQRNHEEHHIAEDEQCAMDKLRHADFFFFFLDTDFIIGYGIFDKDHFEMRTGTDQTVDVWCLCALLFVKYGVSSTCVGLLMVNGLEVIGKRNPFLWAEDEPCVWRTSVEKCGEISATLKPLLLQVDIEQREARFPRIVLPTFPNGKEDDIF